MSSIPNISTGISESAEILSVFADIVAAIDKGEEK